MPARVSRDVLVFSLVVLVLASAPFARAEISFAAGPVSRYLPAFAGTTVAVAPRREGPGQMALRMDWAGARAPLVLGPCGAI